jgi:DNA-binding FadR family transcriptional regulator
VSSPSPAAPRKADQVARDLMTRIVGGTHAVGSILPHEPELAAHYRVNRSVVREAIKLLEVHRLVQPIRRRGTVVLDPRASSSPDVLRAMLVPASGVIDAQVLGSVLELRALLDAEMWALAATRRRASDLAAMTRGLERARKAQGVADAYYAEVDGLALLAARASGNPVLEMLNHWHRSIVADLMPLLRLVRPPADMHVGGLAQLIDHVAARRAEPARRLVLDFHAWLTPRLQQAAGLSRPSPPARTPRRTSRKELQS